MNPNERRRRRAELHACRTPADYFAFATKYLAHQQWEQEITQFIDFATTRKPVRICELGLFNGGTNLMLTHAIPTVREIIGVDLHIRNAAQLRYFAEPIHKQIYVRGKTCDDVTLGKVRQALGSEK